MNYPGEVQRMMRENAALRESVRARNQHLKGVGQVPSDAGTKHEFYVYTQNFTSDLNNAVAPTGTGNGSINIQADSDFVLQKLTYFADIAKAAQTENTRVIPLMSIQIRDTGSGRDIIENATPVSNIFGTGQLPFILPTKKLFLARSTIAITVTNFDAAVTYNLQLAFVGYKVFRGLVN